jgi:muramoyltetrapeptide carboxypeptidase
MGFSDITVLHAVLQRELGWTTFYSPMVRGWERQHPATHEAWRHTLMDGATPTITTLPGGVPTEVIHPGRADGPVLGGCLSLIVTLTGTPWEIDFRGAIVMFEDIGEEPYRIDRMLAHLLLAGKLNGCAGIVIGEHIGCESQEPSRSLALRDVFHDLLGPLGVPVLYGLPVGHGSQLLTAPLGARAELDTDANNLRFLEPGVE